MSQEERLANLPPNLRAGNGHELVPKPEVELLNPKISWQQIAFAEDPTFPPQWDEAKRQEFKTAQVTWRKALSFLDPISGGKRAISEIVDKKLFSIAKDSIHDNLYLDRGYLKALPEPVKPLIQRWLEDQTYGVLGMMCNARRSTNAIVKAFGDKIMQIAVSSDPKTNGNPRLYKQNLKGLELLCSIKNKVTS